MIFEIPVLLQGGSICLVSLVKIQNGPKRTERGVAHLTEPGIHQILGIPGGIFEILALRQFISVRPSKN